MANLSAHTPSFALPTVTEEDLRSFHAKHFSGLQSPASFFTAPVEFRQDDEAEEDEDDGLGYYADGTKRTLTDEQVKMFRHSEIQKLLRERRRRDEEERSESGFDAEAELAIPVERFSPKELTPQPTVTDIAPLTEASRDSAKRSLSPKRKWDTYIDRSEANEQAFTHRRLARELDKQQVDPIDLMYGDDDSATAKKPKTNTTFVPHQSSARKLRSYDD